MREPPGREHPQVFLERGVRDPEAAVRLLDHEPPNYRLGVDTSPVRRVVFSPTKLYPVEPAALGRTFGSVIVEREMAIELRAADHHQLQADGVRWAVPRAVVLHVPNELLGRFDQLEREIPNWWRHVTDWLGVALEVAPGSDVASPKLVLVENPDDDENVGPRRYSFAGYAGEHHASIAQLDSAFAWAGRSEELPLEFGVLLRAQEAFGVSDARICVIEAYAAVELALTRTLENALGRLNCSESFEKWVLRQSWGFRRLCERCSALGVKIAVRKEDFDFLADARNTLAHRGTAYPLEAAERALYIARQLVSDYGDRTWLEVP